MLGLLSLLGVGLAVALSLAVWYVMHRISHPPRKTYAWAVSRGLPSDPGELDAPLEFNACEQSLRVGNASKLFPVWEIRGEAPDGPVVIFTPGWGDSRIGLLPRLGALRGHASTIIAWDPPGHGDAPGTWSKGVREPAMLLELADEAWRSSGKQCVLMGSSAGGGVSVAAAALDAQRPEGERAIIGVIAEAPYRHAPVPARNVIRSTNQPWALNGPIAFALMGIIEGVGPRWRGFDRAELAATLRVPVLVLHGDQDAVCPVDDGRDIAAASGGELAVIAGGGHNDLWTNEAFGLQSADAVELFMRSLSDPV